MTNATTAAKRGKMLTYGGGGWVIVLAVAFTIVVSVIMVLRVAGSLRSRPPGDGVDPASYGFVLDPCLVPGERIAAAQKHRDIIPALVDPPVVDADGVAELNRKLRGKFLVPSDRVIGVVAAGEARAYPITMLASHAIVNDRLGGRAIAVTYDPLCDSAVAFDREIEGEVLELGVSGLVCDANLLLYDRRDLDADASLWSQLQARAVTGPAAEAGHKLARLPVELVTWEAWRAARPDTTVMAPDVTNSWLLDVYKKTNYDAWYRSDELLFGVEPPPAGGPPLKAPCLVLPASDIAPSRVFTLDGIASRADATGRWTAQVDGRTLEFLVGTSPLTVRVLEAGAPVDAISCRWFAWHATDPDAVVEVMPIPATTEGQEGTPTG